MNSGTGGEQFFKGKGIEVDNERLSRVYDNARDYTQRGYTYFVFDRINISGETKFIEPLLYRLKAEIFIIP